MAGEDPFGAAARLDGVGSAMAAARDAVDVVVRDRGLRRVAASAISESLLLGARASAALAGSDEPLERLRDGSAGPVARGAALIGTELIGSAARTVVAPLSLWTRFHQLAGAGWIPNDQLGHLRAICDPAPNDAEELPPAPPPAIVWARLRALSAALTGPIAAPRLVVAALIHAELATLRPFGRANGIVARAAERAALIAFGIDPLGLTVPESGHGALRDEYHPALHAYATGRPAGVAAWLRHAGAAVARGAELAPAGPAWAKPLPSCERM